MKYEKEIAIIITALLIFGLGYAIGKLSVEQEIEIPVYVDVDVPQISSKDIDVNYRVDIDYDIDYDDLRFPPGQNKWKRR